MPTAGTPTAATTNFNQAIWSFSSAAYQQFTTAQSHVGDAGAAGEKAREELMGALAQLSSAAHMQSEQRNRAGLDAVVDLMTTTADAAGKISTRLVSLLHAEDTGAPTDYDHINALRNTLDVLARLSPSDVWTAPSSPAKGG